MSNTSNTQPAAVQPNFGLPRPPRHVAWDDEEGQSYVWGTHDPQAANRVYRQAAQGMGDPEKHPDFQEAEKLWANPAVLDLVEVWPDHMVSRDQQPGWVPFLQVAL